jgi:6-phosphogluconolactonase
MTRTTSFTTRCQSALSSGARGEKWTRRDFVRGAAGVIALPHLPLGVAPSQEFAYVASGDGSVHVFSARGEHWTRIQTVASRAPGCVLLSPNQKTLYVANDVEEYEGIPRGTVEAFHVDPFEGRLTLSSREPLSLSATRPRHMAISPDGKLLAVAAYSGGIYNLLPVAEDGTLSPPSSIFKDAGCGPCAPLQASAHPHTLFFDTRGNHLLSSDLGGDRLSVFAVEDATLVRRMQRSTGEGSGPGAWVFHPTGSLVYAWHELEGALTCYPYGNRTIGEVVQRV